VSPLKLLPSNLHRQPTVRNGLLPHLVSQGYTRKVALMNLAFVEPVQIQSLTVPSSPARNLDIASWRVYLYSNLISVQSSWHHALQLFMQTCWHRQTRLPRSRLASMTAVGSVRGARSGQSIRLCRPRRGQAKYREHRQCGRRRWMSICCSGRGSGGRAAVPSCGRMRKTLEARRWGRLGVRGECGRPLLDVVNFRYALRT
jgi:hypothetical protein